MADEQEQETGGGGPAGAGEVGVTAWLARFRKYYTDRGLWAKLGGIAARAGNGCCWRH